MKYCNRWLIFIAAASMTVLAGCSGKTNGPNQTANCEVSEELSTNNMKTLQLDNVEVTWIQDTPGEHMNPVSLLAGAEALLPDSVIQQGIPSSMSTFLVKSGGLTILFDTGLGSPSSLLESSLKSLGLSLSEIQYIYLTHLHNDHIGGMLQGDSIMFPNAAVYLSRVEHDAWLNMSEEKNQNAVKTINAYKERLHLFEFGDSLPGGVKAMEAIGHTPGHTVFQTGQLLIIGDLIHGAAIQFEHPEICATYDMDPEKAAETRKYFIKYAEENHLTMAGMHLPAPAFR